MNPMHLAAYQRQLERFRRGLTAPQRQAFDELLAQTREMARQTVEPEAKPLALKRGPKNWRAA